MAHDVFISYATEDKVTADAVCARIEQNGIRCWIAPRDVVPGANWKASIVTAIKEAQAMVLVFSAHSNASTEVPKEVDQAVKNGISIVTFRIEDVPANPQLEYELRGRHWLDALTRPMERHIDLLVTTLRALLDKPASTTAVTSVGAPPVRRLSLGVAFVVLVAVVAAGFLGWWVTRSGSLDSVGKREAVINTEPGPAVDEPVAPTATPKPGLAPAPPTDSGMITRNRPTPSVVPTRQPPRTEVSASNPAPPTAEPQPRVAADVPPSPFTPVAASPSAVSDAAPAGVKVIGCWRIAGGPGIIVVKADGTFVSGGVINGTWKPATQPVGSYVFQFPDDTAQGQISADGRQLSNSGAPNDPLSRVSGNSDNIVGVWRFSSGLTVSVEPDGTAKIATVNGRWHVLDRARRLYHFTWPGAQPIVTVSPDGNSLKYVDTLRGVVVDLQRLPC